MPWSISRSRRTLVMVACLAACAVPRAAETQRSPSARSRVPWTVIDAIGYGGVGFGLGLAGASESSLENAVLISGASTAVGVGLGVILGHDASAAVANGRDVGVAHRTAVLAGAVLAGASIGALVAVPLINGSADGTPLGSDESTVAITTVAGATIGALFAARQRHAFAPMARVSVAPWCPRNAGPGFRIGMTF